VLCTLPGHPHAAHDGEAVVELGTMLFVATLHGATAGRNAPMGRRHPLHHVGREREEIVAPVMTNFGPSIGDLGIAMNRKRRAKKGGRLRPGRNSVSERNVRGRAASDVERSCMGERHSARERILHRQATLEE
jgi:hypothetical protein